MAVLLTRPAAENAKLEAELAALGIPTLSWPLSRIVIPRADLTLPEDIEALIFTSGNAVRAFSDASPARDLPVFCVGERTADLAESLGFQTIDTRARDVMGLAYMIEQSPLTRFFYARGQDISHDLAHHPQLCDKQITEAVLYRAEPAEAPESPVQDALQKGAITGITLWSRRNSEILADHLAESPDWQIQGTDLLAISHKAAEPLQNAGFRRILVAASPDSPAMITLISAAMRQ